ncbi:MAG: nucleotidyltransferase family protein [Clostridiales bacterium]|nr:nucleotidyltransferase family protein [Clostridiales bacterium]
MRLPQSFRQVSCVKIGCVLLAAGAGKRFGGGKLLYAIDGEPMIARALRLYKDLQFEVRVCVTRAEAAKIQILAHENGFSVVINPEPERGVGTSVAIATEAILAREPALDGILYAVADQPFLTQKSVRKLMDTFDEHPNDIVSLGFEKRRGNPAIFPAEFYPELCALKEDTGGGAVIKRHTDRLRFTEVLSARELDDIDSKEN